MLRIEHLTKTYGEKKAVDDLSLHIEPGQIYGFIGHNGAGKTTTIKACCGILKFDAGEICIDGKSIKTQALECKREMAYIPDNPDPTCTISYPVSNTSTSSPTSTACPPTRATSAYTVTPTSSSSPMTSPSPSPPIPTA